MKKNTVTIPNPALHSKLEQKAKHQNRRIKKNQVKTQSIHYTKLNNKAK